jgi:hypothetical protein
MFVNRRTGGITVAQWPNVALSVFIASSIARRLNIAKGTLQTPLRPFSAVAILVWAADESIREVNAFRWILWWRWPVYRAAGRGWVAVARSK